MRSSALDITFQALADPTRRAVIELLREAPSRAGQLAQALDISAPALSRHLRVLRRGGLITDDQLEHDARVRLYRLRPEAFGPLQQWLAELEHYWALQLSGFALHVNNKKRSSRA
jgi:DNA-binding transcriptional ArsR family regulator